MMGLILYYWLLYESCRISMSFTMIDHISSVTLVRKCLGKDKENVVYSSMVSTHFLLILIPILSTSTLCNIRIRYAGFDKSLSYTMLG